MNNKVDNANFICKYCKALNFIDLDNGQVDSSAMDSQSQNRVNYDSLSSTNTGPNVMPFGQYKNVPFDVIIQTEKGVGYLKWLQANADLYEETSRAVSEAIKKSESHHVAKVAPNTSKPGTDILMK